MQHGRCGIEPDPHPGLQQGAVVRPLRVVDHELVGLGRSEQLDLDPAVGRSGDREQQGFVGDEVRAHDREPPQGGVDQRVEQPQVRIGAEARPGRQQLHRHLTGWLPRFARPMSSISSVSVYQSIAKTVDQFVDDGAGQPDIEVLPVPTDLHVLLLEIAGVDHVLRTHERDLVVDHEQLAVVAQIGSAPASPQRLDRHHLMPVDPVGGEPAIHRAEAGIAPRAQVVVEHPDLDPAPDRSRHRVEERRGRRVEGEDVDLEVDHLAASGADRLGHGGDAVAVAGKEPGGRAEDTRQ